MVFSNLQIVMLLQNSVVKTLNFALPQGFTLRFHKITNETDYAWRLSTLRLLNIFKQYIKPKLEQKSRGNSHQPCKQ